MRFIRLFSLHSIESSLRFLPKVCSFLFAATLLLFLLLGAQKAFCATGQSSALPGQTKSGTASAKEKDRIAVYLFWGEGCSHCEEEKHFLSRLASTYPELDVKEFEVLHDKKNLDMLIDLLHVHARKASGVPVTFIGAQVFEGFSKKVEDAMAQTIRECRSSSCADPVSLLHGREYTRAVERLGRNVQEGAAPAFDVPFLGRLDLGKASLPLLTVAIAGMDGVNPCGFFVLLSLLGILVHGGSRNKMLIVGGTFVFVSGFVYFLSMAAWLNLYLIMGNVSGVTATAGFLSLAIAAVNIKDFFLFKKGVSLSISDSAKPRLFDRFRRLLRSTSFFPVIAGTITLAILANFYELLCTAGFPLVFTRILTLHDRSALSSYLYLALYNGVRVIPLLFVVLALSLTLSSKKLTERHARVLKLLAGAMMLVLGTVLLIDPAVLNNLLSSLVLVAGAVVVTVVLMFTTRRPGYP